MELTITSEQLVAAIAAWLALTAIAFVAYHRYRKVRLARLVSMLAMKDTLRFIAMAEQLFNHGAKLAGATMIGTLVDYQRHVTGDTEALKSIKAAIKAKLKEVGATEDEIEEMAEKAMPVNIAAMYQQIEILIDKLQANQASIETKPLQAKSHGLFMLATIADSLAELERGDLAKKYGGLISPDSFDTPPDIVVSEEQMIRKLAADVGLYAK